MYVLALHPADGYRYEVQTLRPKSGGGTASVAVLAPGTDQLMGGSTLRGPENTTVRVCRRSI
jgi:hypothetical protein